MTPRSFMSTASKAIGILSTVTLSFFQATSIPVSAEPPANSTPSLEGAKPSGDVKYVINGDQSLTLEPSQTKEPAPNTGGSPTSSTGPRPRAYLKGCAQTCKRRSGRLLKDPLIVIYPIFHPLLASKYLEKHGYSAALGLGIMGASSVAASRK